MKNKTLIGAVVLGAGLFLLFKDRLLGKTAPPPPPPPPPGSSTSEIEAWVNTILSIYGNAKWLWEPGGPFFKGPGGAAVNPDLLPDYRDYV